MIKKQFGLTLLELLVGLIIGMMLIAGIGQLFSQSQKSFRLQKNLSDMTDDATFILESLAKGLLLAGYSSTGNRDFGDSSANVLGSSFTFNSSCGNSCEFIKGDNNSLIYRFKYTGAATTGDELSNFVGTTSLASATPAPASGDIISVYIYKQNDPNGIPVLYSRAGFHTPPAMAPASVPVAKPLISEVEKIEFRYGVRVRTYNYNTFNIAGASVPYPNPDSATLDPFVAAGGPDHPTNNIYNNKKRTPENDTFWYTTYDKIITSANGDPEIAVHPITALPNPTVPTDPANLNASNFTWNSTDWTSVFAIKVYLVMRSVEKNLTRTPMTYEIEGVTYTPTDNRLYKVFSKTIYLRAVAK